jgi:hypothetical protein
LSAQILRHPYGMQNERFEIRLSADRRQELAELARESGLSAADIARLAITRLLAHPGVLLGVERKSERVEASR